MTSVNSTYGHRVRKTETIITDWEEGVRPDR
jgi:hypothetical protein